MSDPIHPSPETLSAYCDNELSESERASVDAYLKAHPETQNLLNDFALLNGAGPELDDHLPGDGYWMDLPDRILARIATEDASAPAVPASAPVRAPSFWGRLFQGQGAWRFALGTGTAAALLAASLWVLHEPANPVDPGVAAVQPSIPSVSPSVPAWDAADHLASAETSPVDAETYSRRVVRTLGGGTLGESLNPGIQGMPSPQDDPSSANLRTVGLGHSNALPPLRPESAQEMERIICNGPGESKLESAMLLSVKADELGHTALAREGYQVVMQNAPISDPLHWEANYRLTYSLWMEHMASLDEMGRARALSELDMLAQKTYQSWLSSGQLRDCQRAYCLNRTLKTVASDMTTLAATQQTAVRVNELAECVRGEN